eukprot:4843924-Pleurochrysis_carterae.AAC.5
MHGSYKGSRDVRVYKSARMRWLVTLFIVRLTSRVGLDADVTTVKTFVGERRRCVGGNRWQGPESGGARAEPAVHASCGVRRRHHTDVMYGARGVDS